MDSVIDSMMLVEEGESDKQEDLFKVHHIQNPTFQRLFQVASCSAREERWSFHL